MKDKDEMRTRAYGLKPMKKRGVEGLWKTFHEVGLKILDVGARGGSLSWTGELAPFSTYCACEPDAAAAEKLEGLIRDQFPWRDVRVLTEALGDVTGSVTINLTKNPGFSSLLLPNGELVADFGLEEECAVQHAIEVPSLTLADAALRYDMADLALLKLDTQGTELAILASGDSLVRGPVQAVFVEVEFRPFYIGQALFSEVELYLRNAGFELIRLDPVSRRRKVGQVLGYSRHEITWGHALFMKRPPTDSQCSEAFVYLVRQIAIAIAAEHFDLAADRLSRPECKSILEANGLFVSASDLEEFIERRVSSQLYLNFVRTWAPIRKDRPKSYITRG